jgi:hypothetical protein
MSAEGPDPHRLAFGKGKGRTSFVPEAELDRRTGIAIAAIPLKMVTLA